MRRLLLIIAGALFFIGVWVPFAAAYYLAFTAGGFQFLISRAPAKLGNIEIAIRDPSGTIASGIRIGQLDIDHPLVHLTIKGIQGRIELLPIVLQTVRTKYASIDSVFIQTKRRTRPSIPGAPAFLPRWLKAEVEQAHIEAATLVVASGTRWEATNLNSSISARQHRISLFGAGLQMGHLHIAGAGELRASDPLRLDLQGRLVWSPDDQPTWEATTTATGDLAVLKVVAQTTAPFHSDFTGQALDLTGRWHWFGNALVHDLDVTRWGGSKVLGLLSATLAARGNLDGFAARGPIDSSGLKVGIFDGTFEGAYSNHVLWAKHFELTHHKSGAHVAGGGTIEVVRNGPQLDLHGAWRDFRWPLVGKVAPFHSASGDFTLDGTWPYSVHGSGFAQVRDLPSMPVTLDGALARNSFSFNEGALELYDGHATVSGQVTWTPSESWSIAGHVTDIDPSQIRADLPGRLSFEIASQGTGFETNGDFSIDVRDIAGRLRGVPASGAGKVVRTRMNWEFDRLRLGLGGTNLALDGHIDRGVDLRFSLLAKDLSLLAPDSRGELESTGTVRGTPQAPIVLANARGRAIRHEGLTIDDFNAAIDFNPDAGYESKIDTHVHNLVFRDRKLETLTLRLDGRSTNYIVKLDAKALGLAMSAQASGPFANGAWQGQLHALDFNGMESVRLKLEHPVSLFVAANAAHAERLCLVGQPGSLCADGEWNPQQWTTTFVAKDMPLSTFTAGMTQAVEYGGRINLATRLSGGAQDPVVGSLRAELTDAQLSHRLSSGRIDRTKIGSGLITLNANRAEIRGEVGLESGDVGTIKGSLVAQRNSDDWQKMPVQGALHAHADQLGLITLYVPDIDRAAGRLDADMKIAGTLGTPLVDGSLKISDGEIDYYQVNLGLRQVSFDALLTDNGVNFDGSTRIGSGTANAKGRLEWRNSLPYGKVHVEGSNLRVVDVPEAQIDASPSLEFNITGRRIEVAGGVKIPYAKIVPTDLAGAVRPSSDEVIVGQEQTDPSRRFEVLSSITLSLLDRVSIDTSGLTGQLSGNITVRSGYEAQTTATGELSIAKGAYTAYARKLDVQRGRLIFTGGPIDNPGIDIRAVKEFPDVIAGVNVRGTLLQPHLSFFSDPSLTQSQIVSLLLSGGSFETAQNHLSGAGNELLAQGGAILAQQLGSRVGIQDVSLESDLTNETSLVLGRYLSPRLYVSYGIALTEQLNVLKLRYSLGDRWTVKTEVGQARGADLVYTIQR